MSATICCSILVWLTMQLSIWILHRQHNSANIDNLLGADMFLIIYTSVLSFILKTNKAFTMIQDCFNCILIKTYESYDSSCYKHSILITGLLLTLLKVNNFNEVLIICKISMKNQFCTNLLFSHVEIICAPCKDSDQPGHQSRLIWDFTFRMEKPLAYTCNSQTIPKRTSWFNWLMSMLLGDFTVPTISWASMGDFCTYHICAKKMK